MNHPRLIRWLRVAAILVMLWAGIGLLDLVGVMVPSQSHPMTVLVVVVAAVGCLVLAWQLWQPSRFFLRRLLVVTAVISALFGLVWLTR
jgi:hypothetical protein